MISAVIGIGSNSVRMLVAKEENGELIPIMRDRCGTRLFAGLNEGVLSQESIEVSCAAAREMERKAREAGASAIYIFATSAVRDAKNQEEFATRMRMMTGLDIDICAGETEALLSYAGAVRSGHCGMIDIGGGSTEITIGEGLKPKAAISTQMGAVRFHGRYPIASAAQYDAVVQKAMEVLEEGASALREMDRPDTWVGVGGTFTTLAAMDARQASYDRSLVDGYVLGQAVVQQWGHRLSTMSREERLALPGLQPQRADIVAHGLAILSGCMQFFGIEEIRVSDKGNLDGYLRRKLCGEAKG